MRAGYRAVVGARVVALYATGGSVLGAGSAFAAPSDITLDSCHTTVQANPGDNLVVSAKTVLAPELKDLAANPLVGQPLVAALNPVLSSLTVGSLTVQRDATSITGVEIAKQVVAALPPGIPSQGAEAVRVAVVNACQITIEKSTSAPAPKSSTAATGQAPAPSASNAAPESAATVNMIPTAAPAPQQAPAEQPVFGMSEVTAFPAAPAPQQAPPAPVTSYGHIPRYTSNDLTSVPAGGAGFSVNAAPVPPQSLTGYGLSSTAPIPAPAPVLPRQGAPGPPALAAPQVGAVSAPPPVAHSPAERPVSGMSAVTAFPAASASRSQVPASAVLAALLLSLTTAALVRTWILSGAAPADPALIV